MRLSLNYNRIGRAALVCGVAAAAVGVAGASQRRFVFTYEATTHPPGDVEYEQWEGKTRPYLAAYITALQPTALLKKLTKPPKIVNELFTKHMQLPKIPAIEVQHGNDGQLTGLTDVLLQVFKLLKFGLDTRIRGYL